VKRRWAAAGFLASCAILVVYWIVSTPLPDQPRYGYYSRRFIAFARSFPITGPGNWYEYLGNGAAALGALHILNPPLLITSIGHDQFHASGSLFWRSDGRFIAQALILSLWWWWLLDRLATSRGDPRVTLAHIALPIPAICLAIVLARYRLSWIRSPYGLAGFAIAALIMSAAAISFAIAWGRRRGVSRLHSGAAMASATLVLGLVVWPPLVLESRLLGAISYRFIGHDWIFKRFEPSVGTHIKVPTEHESHIALSLLGSEILFVVAVLIASASWRPSNMALQRTRRPRIRSGRSLRSLGSPLNAQPLAAAKQGASRRLPRRPGGAPIQLSVNRLAASPGSEPLVIAGVSGRRGA
jgi:hypothetical protein